MEKLVKQQKEKAEGPDSVDKVSNAAAKQVLGIEFTPMRRSAIDMVYSMIKAKKIPKPAITLPNGKAAKAFNLSFEKTLGRGVAEDKAVVECMYSEWDQLQELLKDLTDEERDSLIEYLNSTNDEYDELGSILMGE